jgi:hypothetical protein
MDIREEELVAVSWVDQNSYTDNVPAKGSLSEATGYTIGFFLEQNEDWLCIAMERMEITKGNGPQFRHVVSFPKCAVKSVRRLLEGSLIVGK